MTEQEIANTAVEAEAVAKSNMDAGMWMIQNFCKETGIVEKLRCTKARFEKHIKDIDRMLELCAADPVFVERYALLGRLGTAFAIDKEIRKQS